MSHLVAPDTVETSFHIRFAETDSMRIVHHSNYLVWFEEARSAFMRAIGTSYADFERDGVSLAVSEVQVRYIAPAIYDRRVTIRCKLEQVQSRKLTFSYHVLDAATQKVLAVGQTKHICIRQGGEVSRIPEAWLMRFQTSG